MKPRLISLCSGYGGLEMGLRLAGIDFDLAAVADPHPAATAVLAHHHPCVPNLGDITAVEWATTGPVAAINWAGHGPADILTAGYPCQPFSLAGQREGTDDARFIWPAVAYAVRALRPRLVFLENVPGHLSLGFGRVLGDLATLGYVGSWRCVRASDVGAAHRRERVFIAARPADTAGDTGWLSDGDGIAVGGSAFGRRAHGGLIPTPAARLGKATSLTPAAAARRQGSGHHNLDDWAALLPTPRATDATKGGPNQRGSSGDLMLPSAVQPGRFGAYEAAINRWEAVVGRPVPEPTEPNPFGTDAVRLAAPFTEWLMGLPSGHVTAVEGLSRNDMLGLLGNGVVPQQAAHAARLLGVARTFEGVPA